MTITNESIKTTVTGNGSQITFTYSFLIPSQSAASLILEDLTTGLVQTIPPGSWTLTGAGNPNGGTFTYPETITPFSQPITAQQRLTLVREVPATQPTNLGNQGGYYPQSVEGALDWIVMQVQQFIDEARRALRVPLQEQGLPDLLPAPFRANRLLSFDSAGLPALLPIQPDNNTTVIAMGSTVARTLAARFADAINVLDFGAVPDWNGTSGTDNTAAFNAAFAYAAVVQKMAYVPFGDFYCAGAVSLAEGALGLRMDGQMFSPGNLVALTLGGSGSTRNQNKVYGPIRVLRTTQSNWASEADIGVRIWNADNCVCVIERAERFTINVQLASDDRGVEDSDFFYGRIIDGKIGVDMRTFRPGPTSYVNSCRHYGGHFACSSATNPGVDRYGFRLSRNSPGDYVLHNAHDFNAPAFELQVGSHLSIPFLMEVDGRGCVARGIRMEACSPYVAHHTSAMNDCVYEVSFVGTFGPFISVLYSGTATRAGGSARVIHSAVGADQSLRLVDGHPNIRAVAYRDRTVDLGGVGFERMAVMSTNPSGSPTTLNTLCFPALALITLNSNSITLPTSRAVGFVVDLNSAVTTAGIPKELFAAVEGELCRVCVVQFDNAENVLTNTSPLLFSSANAVYDGAPSYMWTPNVNVDQLSGGYPFFYWQRITFHPNCRYAFIGVRGADPASQIRSLRIFSGPLLAPAVLFGNGISGARNWGSRELEVKVPWTVPSLAAGATATIDVTLPGVRGGDFLSCGHDKDTGFQNGGVVFHAVQGGTASTNQVRVTAQNISSGTINVGAGQLFVRAVRPRLL